MTATAERTAAPDRYWQALERQVTERIGRDLAEHTITAKYRAGLYGHWRCQKPGTSNLYFDVVTWPGSLCLTGDMGDYLFQCTEDMIGFMRSVCAGRDSIDYRYVAEKCVAHDGRLKEWRHELFEERLAERLEGLGGGERAQVVKKLTEIRDEFAIYEAEHDGMKAMYESGLWDSSDLPDCRTYTFHFVWCVHAIRWFCRQIETAKAQ